MRELEALETEFSALRTPDSPTQRVGAGFTTSLANITHAEPMLSLGNVFSDAELDAWAARTERDAGGPVHYLCELKIDGLAVNLTYAKGRLVSAATRGTGVVGEDVTANARTIAEIPDQLTGDDVPEFVEVRGEIYFPTAAFADLNARLLERGEKTYVNPRNAASGSLRNKDPARGGQPPDAHHRARHRRAARLPPDLPVGRLRGDEALGPADHRPLARLRQRGGREGLHRGVREEAPRPRARHRTA